MSVTCPTPVKKEDKEKIACKGLSAFLTGAQCILGVNNVN